MRCILRCHGWSYSILFHSLIFEIVHARTHARTDRVQAIIAARYMATLPGGMVSGQAQLGGLVQLLRSPSVLMPELNGAMRHMQRSRRRFLREAQMDPVAARGRADRQ